MSRYFDCNVNSSVIIRTLSVIILVHSLCSADRSSSSSPSPSSTPSSSSSSSSSCAQIESAFAESVESSEQEACRCYIDSSVHSRAPHSDSADNVWIGCTRQKMPHVFRALTALNGTVIHKLWIWDSLVNIIPADMFAQIHPRILSIDRSSLSVFRAGAFSNIGQRLKILQLRNNILKHIEPTMFDDLTRLEVLDLGGNKISEIKKGLFDRLEYLEELNLSDNQLTNIEDDAFKALSNLKTLNLANNKLSVIKRNTFKGLNNVENLNIQNNNLLHVDWAAFSHMKNLKSLNLGTNRLSEIKLRGLHSLEKLFINNNSFESMKKIALRDLPSLIVLNIDRNSITEITDDDFNSFSDNTRLTSLSAASNKISHIGTRALQSFRRLTVLSLQNNELQTLSPDDGVSFLRPLKKLTNLYLSGNQLSSIDDNDFHELNSLEVLSLDHNEISQIGAKAFSDLPLKRLYLNNNRLYYLPKGSFDSLSAAVLDAVDLSENMWQCMCGEEWLSDWLISMGERNVAGGSMGCLADKQCVGVDKKNDNHSVWITVIAAILAVFSLLMLIAIAFLYLEDGKRVDRLLNPLRRVPSDMVNLIPNKGPILIAPDSSGIEPLLSVDLTPSGHPLSRSTLSNSATPPRPIIMEGPRNGQLNNVIDKKRVRFNFR